MNKKLLIAGLIILVIVLIWGYRTKGWFKSKEAIIQDAANQIESQSGSLRMSVQGKYALLNAKLAQYGIMVLPDGQNPPPASNLHKCCCRSSTFFGLIGTNCYWNVDCNSQSAQSSCGATSGALQHN